MLIRTSQRVLVAVIAVLVLLPLLSRDTAAAVVTYNPADSTMAHLELAAAPRLLGPTSDHPGMWEYVYDFYHAAGTWESRLRLDGFEADLIANVHDIGFGVGVYQAWNSQSYIQPPLWGGEVDKQFLPSYWNGGGGWELPSAGGCVGCENVAYEYINEWHNPFEYNSSIFYGVGHYPFGEVNVGGMLTDEDVGIAGTDRVTFPVWNPGFPNQYSVGGLGMTVRIVHPNAPGTITWNTYHWNANDLVSEIVGPSASESGPTCVIGDANCDGYVDIAGDILPAFTNFTGPGSFGKTREQGDVHGPGEICIFVYPGPCDTDVDVSDLLTMFGNFTGPPPDTGSPEESGGLVAAEVGDANIPDLIYDSATGEVVLDVDGSGIIGYVLKNGSNDFVFGNHLQILAGVKTSVLNELSEAAFASSVGANSLGNVFPTGMDLAALTAYLTVNDVSRSLGAPVVPFDLVVLGPAIPEPSAFALAAVGLLALGLMGRRRI